MLARLVGPVDMNSAIVLAFMFACACIVITSLIIKRRSRADVSNEFFLAKMRQEAEQAARVYQLETERDFKFKQLDRNLITSHRSDDN